MAPTTTPPEVDCAWTWAERPISPGWLTSRRHRPMVRSMSIGMEIELGPHPTTVMDEALQQTSQRSTYSAAEVADLLLDIQQAFVRWSEEDSP